MRRFQTTADEPQAAVNLTPMLDVVFIMLIFFIVTAVFVREQGLPVNPPDPARVDPVENKQQPIVIELHANRRLRIAGKDVDERLLDAQLARLHAERPEAAVVLRPAADSSTDLVVSVMDSARKVGIYNIKFASS